MDKIKEELVSVIVPIYNVEKYLKKCLSSIAGQTYSNIEVIMVNDGATDGSRDIALEFQKKDNRFRLYDKKNGGLSSGRNYGMKYVTGDFVSFVDSDDFLAPTYVEKLLNAFDDETDIVIGDYVIFNSANNKSFYHGNRLKKEEFCNQEDKKRLMEYLLFGLCPVMSVWKNMYRVNFYQKNKLAFVSERVVYAEDKLFHVEAYMKARKIKIIPEVVFYHLVNPGSLSQGYRKNQFEMYSELQSRIIMLLERFCDENFLEEYNNYTPSMLGSVMFGLCKCGYKEAMNNIQRVLSEPMVKNIYSHHYEKRGYFRYRLVYNFGRLKFPFIVVVGVKVMLSTNSFYRKLQRKEEYL